METKQVRSVIHVYIKASNQHYYFGSIANIYQFFNNEEIGISYGSLRNYGLNNKEYENKYVVIRKGKLLSKSNK